ncbi:MAG: hypothetical protein U9N02_08440 [Campylobacterota bacterium]|nr:hypothetical protein [Campylobacterota bacterium]
MIDIEIRSEERFSRISTAYEGHTEKKLVIETIENIINKYDYKPNTHATELSHNREVFVVEYHDDMHRESGEIFKKIMKALNITECI